jgi:hypothetical protein
LSEKITVADGIKVRRAAPKSAKESRVGRLFYKNPFL